MGRFPEIHGTTVLCVRHNGKVVVAGDGQVTIGNAVMKHGARKVRKVYKDKVIVGFAGAGADALALSERFEAKLEQFSGNLRKAVVELSKDWRTDRMLRRLEALMIVAASDESYLLSGSGDVIEPDDGILAIGSGGAYALAAARALVANTEFDAKTIAQKAMNITAQICIYTNDQLVIEELEG
jgi:ATP-dependent HslUV protease subunit HslV